jgi:hypothetical protein
MIFNTHHLNFNIYSVLKQLYLKQKTCLTTVKTITAVKQVILEIIINLNTFYYSFKS